MRDVMASCSLICLRSQDQAQNNRKLALEVFVAQQRTLIHADTAMKKKMSPRF
jgi:hypothetical protein